MRNANNYGEVTGDSAPYGAEFRAYMFGDLARIKSDMASIDVRINEAVADSNARTDQIVQTMYDRLAEELRSVSAHYNQLVSQVSSTTTLTAQQSAQLTELRKKLDDMSIAVGVLDGLEGRFSTQLADKLDTLNRGIDQLVENRMLRQQNQDNNEIPRATLKDLPGKVSALDTRLASLEKRMWLIQIIGTLIAGLALNVGKDIVAKLFH